MAEQSKVNQVTNRFTTVLFMIYLLVLCWVLLLKLGVRFSYMENRSVNLIPFREAVILNGKMDVWEIMLNVVIFVPLGIYAGILWARWIFGKKLFFIFLMSVIVEGLQFILAVGAFDLTDIITNTLGGIMGLMLFKAIEKAFHNRVKAQKFINLVAAVGTGFMILFLLLLKMNLLPIRYQ
jgi:glycopeptide antibiotics resistance protein